MTLALEMHVQRCLRVTSTTEKLNFAAPKTRSWRHTAAGYAFQRGRWRGQRQSGEPRGSPVGPGRGLPAGTKDGDEGSRCSPAVASAAQMPAPYGSTDWHGSAGPRHGEMNGRAKGYGCSSAPTCLLSQAAAYFTSGRSLPAAYQILHTEWRCIYILGSRIEGTVIITSYKAALGKQMNILLLYVRVLPG